MKTSILAAVITIFVPYHFYYSFIFFVHRDHPTFDLVDVQYLQNVVFSSKSLLKFLPANKKSPLREIYCSPNPLPLFAKP